MSEILFNGWTNVLGTIINGVSIYIVLIIGLRISGKRSLSKLNAFDFVVTVALGSVFASTITSSSVSLVQGMAGIITLLFLQYLITKLSVWSHTFSKGVKAAPTILFYKGKYNEKEMKAERLTPGEIIQSVRKAGQHSMDTVLAVVLESDGTLSVIPKGEAGSDTNSEIFVDIEQDEH